MQLARSLNTCNVLMLQERRGRGAVPVAAGVGAAADAGDDGGEGRVAGKWYVGGSESQPQSVRDRNQMRARCLAARALGMSRPRLLHTLLSDVPFHLYDFIMSLIALNDTSANHKLSIYVK